MFCFDLLLFHRADDVIIIENLLQAYRSLKAFLDDTDRKIEVLKEKLEEKQKEINADIEDKAKVQETSSLNSVPLFEFFFDL